MISAIPLLYAALVGACVGSFLNVCVYRLPEGLSVVRPRSRCGACGTQLGWRDNIPIFGWLLLRGRCRYCGVRISPQYPLVELVTAVLWVVAVLRYGVSWQALGSAVFFTLLLGITLTDARTFIIPHEFTMGGIAAALALSLAPGGIAPLQALLGGLLGFGLLWAVGAAVTWYLRRNDRLPEGMDSALGGGDIWMMAMVGSFLGPAGVLLTVFLGALSGLLIFLPFQVVTGRRMIPFGIFLAAGAAIAEPWGAALLRWYRVNYLGGA